MAFRAGLAAVIDDPNAYAFASVGGVLPQIIRHGLAEGAPGWIRSVGNTEDFAYTCDGLDILGLIESDDPSFFAHMWWGYHPTKVEAGSWKSALTFTWVVSASPKDARIQHFEDSGAYKFRFVIDGVTLATGTNNYPPIPGYTYRMCTRIEAVAGSANNIWKLYVNGVEELSYTTTAIYDDGGVLAGHFLGILYTSPLGGIGQIRAGASSDPNNEAYYCNFICLDEQTDIFNEAHFPESKGLFPTSNGDLDGYASNVNDTPGSAEEEQVDDWEANGRADDSDYWKGLNSGSPSQSCNVDDVVLVNTSAIVAQQVTREWVDVGSKSIPHNAITRRASTTRTVALPAITTTVKDIFVANFTLPASGLWSVANINDSQFGSSRTTDGASLFIGALAVVVLSLGTGEVWPPPPPALLLTSSQLSTPRRGHRMVAY